MTLPKALLLIIGITLSLFLYAHEQVAKTILLYDIQRYQDAKGVLFDVHGVLKYQVSALASPPSLEGALAKNDRRLEFPEDRKVVRLAMEKSRGLSLRPRKNFWDFLSVTKVAEAGSR